MICWTVFTEECQTCQDKTDHSNSVQRSAKFRYAKHVMLAAMVTIPGFPRTVEAVEDKLQMKKRRYMPCARKLRE
jgi:hypothetical protein